jgi:putative membrane protein
MINYNSKAWLVNIFVFRRADTLRQLAPKIIMACLYTAIIVYIETTWLKLPDSSPARHFGVLQTLLSFVISMLLVFRTNTAYDRWWEGRKQWGTLVNSSRNLAIKLNAMLPHNDTKNRSFFIKIIPLFATVLQQHLQAETTRLELDTEPHPEIPDFDRTKHIPNQAASVMTMKLNLLYKEGIITGDQLIIVNNEMQAFLDVCGACERIKNSPIPYSYSVFIKKFIFLYTITLPVGLAFTLHYLLIPVVGVVFYVLASLEMIAEEIEDPFGNDENDLPMKKMAANIRKNVEDILR